MTKNTHTYSGEITAGRFYDIQETLQNISNNLKCDLIIHTHQNVLLTQYCAFTFSGTAQQIHSVKETWDSYVAKIEVHTFGIKHPSKYNINSCIIEDKYEQLNINIEIPLLSSIHDLIEDMKKHVDANISIKEGERKFLKGKNISIVVTGEENELWKFKTIFTNHTKVKNLESNAKQSNTSRLKM